MITKSHADGILTLQLEHGKANALDLELLQALSAALTDTDGARAVILTGTGSIFSAGVDLFRFVSDGRTYQTEFLRALGETFIGLFEFSRPIVAAVNGHAIAGGCILTEACDYRLMASGKGRIGTPELLVGVPFPRTALEIMRHAVPPDTVQRLALTGVTVLPDEARQIGLVDEVTTPELLADRAAAVAHQLGAIPSASFALTKRLLREESLRRMKQPEPADLEEMWTSPEVEASIRGYLERTVGRKPSA